MPWDAEFRRRHQPVGSDWTGAGDGDTGDAIQAGMAVGAAPALMDDAWWVAAFQYSCGGVTSCLWERSMPGSIIVDESDRRFVNESMPYVDLGHIQLARNAIPAWLIMDARHQEPQRHAGPAGTAAFTRSCAASSATERGGELYSQRQPMIEPVFGTHQTQPRHRPLPTPRPSRRRGRMAPDHRHPQPPGMKLLG